MKENFNSPSNGKAKILYLFLEETIIYGFLGAKEGGEKGSCCFFVRAGKNWPKSRDVIY
jgi:hypothetical protein